MSEHETKSEKFALSIDEAAERSGLGRSTIYDLMQCGQLAYTKIGARRLILVADLQALLVAFRQGGDHAPQPTAIRMKNNWVVPAENITAEMVGAARSSVEQEAKATYTTFCDNGYRAIYIAVEFNTRGEYTSLSKELGLSLSRLSSLCKRGRGLLGLPKRTYGHATKANRHENTGS